MEIKEHEVYTADETTNLLKISQSTFLRLVKRGILRAAKVGGQYRILGREILHLFSPQIEDKALQTYRKLKNKIKSLETQEVKDN